MILPKNLGLPQTFMNSHSLDNLLNKTVPSRDILRGCLKRIFARNSVRVMILLRHDDGGCYADFHVHGVGELGFDSGSPCNDPLVLSSYYPVWAGLSDGIPVVVLSYHHYVMTSERRAGASVAAEIVARKILKYFSGEEELPTPSYVVHNGFRRLKSSSGFYLTYLGWDWSMCDTEDDVLVCSHDWGREESRRRLERAIQARGIS